MKSTRIIGKNHAVSLSRAMKDCWTNETFSNVVFYCKVSDGKVNFQRANASILAAASPFLSKVLHEFSTWEEDAVILLPDYDQTVLSAALEFLYTGSVSVMGDHNHINEIGNLLGVLGIERWKETPSVPEASSKRLRTKHQKPRRFEDFDIKDSLPSPREVKTRSKSARKRKVLKEQAVELDKGKEAVGDHDYSTAPEEKPVETETNPEDLLAEEMKYQETLLKSVARLETQISRLKKGFISKMERKAAAKERKQNSDVKVRCDECGKMIKESWLKNHKKIHEEHQYCCDKCGRTFVTAAQMKSHYRLQHMDVIAENGGFACTECDRVFKLRKSLKHHMTLHTGEKPHACQFCECRFRSRHVRNNHQRTHTGERPFKCEICGKAFAQKTSLVGHMKTHTKHPADETKRSRGGQRNALFYE